MNSVQSRTMDWQVMNTLGNSWRTRAANVMGSMMDRCFERLQRAQLVDVERSLANSANERELSQRVHRLTSGEFPLNA